MPDQENTENLEQSVAEEVEMENAINIAKVDSDAFEENEDGEEVEGTYKGILYKDDDGNAFIYIKEIDGQETEELESEDEELPKHMDPNDIRHGGDALDIFIIKRNKEKKDANIGY